MRILYKIIGIIVLCVFGKMFLTDYLAIREAKAPAELTLEEVKHKTAAELPRYFVLKEAIRKNLASVQSSLQFKKSKRNISTDVIYPVYSKEEAMDTAFDAASRNEAVVFIEESMKSDTLSIQVNELFQPVSYKVKNMEAELTSEERKLFDEQDIRVAEHAFKLTRNYTVPDSSQLWYGVICFGLAGVLGYSLYTTFRKPKAA